MSYGGCMQPVDAVTKINHIMQHIGKGAFLTVQAGDKLNTMTIGWATMGICWFKPVLMVAVRDSRHTFTLIEAAEDFTVTLPEPAMKDPILFCGTKSGRDMDKFKACDLKTKAAQMVSSPIIDTPGLHVECKIIYKSAMDAAHLDASLHKLYPKGDLHTLYFGEIVACYEM